MRSVKTIEAEIANKSRALQQNKAQLSALKRALKKSMRAAEGNREAQALCALGKGVLTLYDEIPDSRDTLSRFFNRYLTRHSDVEAALDYFSDRELIRALDPARQIPIEIVG